MSYTAGPVRWDHDLIIGDTYFPAVAALATDDVALDITGATGVAELRAEPGGAVVASPTVALIDGAAGTFKWALPAATTAIIPARSYLYFVRLTFADGSIRTVLEGRVNARRVT